MPGSDYHHHMVQDLAAQYEAYPYPLRDAGEQELRYTMMNDLPQIAHYIHGGARSYRRKNYRVLVAGGGTGDATVHLAVQLAGAR